MYRHKKGLNLNDVQEINRGLILWLLRRVRITSRATLSKTSGLKQATITNIINEFINLGIVYETGIIEGNKGRRSIGVSLNTETPRVMGVRLTRHFFKVGLFDLHGTPESILVERIHATEDPHTIVGRMIETIRSVIEAFPNRLILGIGVAIPGPYVRTEGTMTLMTERPGWEGIAIDKEIAEAVSLPVYLEHDAKAAALAEWWLAPARQEHETSVYVTAGQGIGAGIIIDGKLIRGALGLAGEIGHISISYEGRRCACGNRGCLEQYCSTIALSRYAEEGIAQYPDSPLAADRSFPAILKAVGEGDELAVSIVKKAAWYLGFGLAGLVNSYNPHLIVIGDDMSQLGQLFLDGIRAAVREHILPSIYHHLRIELSTFEVDSVLVGVSTLAVEQVLHRIPADQPAGDDGAEAEAFAP
ncbi:MAG: ROK family protein [Ancalomicrobiaceae bacterium]|nr:ROK family protein [Ancalomicrobiaceae bacterium]